jgi:hypothetical protein
LSRRRGGDDYAANKRIEVRDWLANNPRIQVYFTPDDGVLAESR